MFVNSRVMRRSAPPKALRAAGIGTPEAAAASSGGFGIANLLGIDWDSLAPNTAHTVLSLD
jgi:hypothetical protein